MSQMTADYDSLDLQHVAYVIIVQLLIDNTDRLKRD